MTPELWCEECHGIQCNPNADLSKLTAEEQSVGWHRGDHHTCLRPEHLRYGYVSPFRKWMMVVDRILLRRTGADSELNTDWSWDCAFDSDLTPDQAVDSMMEEYGLDLLEGSITVEEIPF